MKVLYVCPFVPWPLVTGGKIRTFNLIKAASHSAEIHLRVIEEDENVPDAREALLPWCASLAFFERGRSNPWRRMLRPKLERWFHSPALIAGVRRELQEVDYNLVHLDELLLARIVPPGRDVPVVQHHHKLDTVLYGNLGAGEGARQRFDLWKLHRLEAESTRRYVHHILCSQEDAQLLRGRYGALDCSVVPSGYDPEIFRPSDPPVPRDPGRIVFLGSMDYGPNVDAVLGFCRDSLPELLRRHPGLVLDIVGGDPLPEVRALASEHVHVTGRVAEVRPYLERAAALVVPLRIGGGTRLKIVEAMALGTPVVSTTTGAEGLGLVDGRHLFLADEPSAFAAAVSRLLEDPEEAAELGRRGRSFVSERYRWEALAEELVDTWERIAFSGKLSPSR